MLAKIQPGVVLANLADSARRSMSASCPPWGTVKTLICVVIPVFALMTGISRFLLGLGGTTSTDRRLWIFVRMSAKRSFPNGKGPGLPNADPGPFRRQHETYRLPDDRNRGTIFAPDDAPV